MSANPCQVGIINKNCVKLDYMRRRHPTTLLLLSFLSLAGLAYLILTYSPNYQLSTMNYQLSTIYLFFPLVFLFIYSIITYLLINTKQGLLFGLFATAYLFLRFIHLTHPFFLILLVVLFLSLELFFKKRT